MTADPCETILYNLAAASLLDSSQYADLLGWVREQRPEPATLGKEIIRRRWLTLYQLKEFQKGRGKELHLGPYLVLDLLGEGGMGRVFKARHSRLGREVALKIIRKEKLSNPTVVSRFRQEIHAAGQLSHPNVVLAFDSEETEAGLFLSMEYVEGVDLTKFVRQYGPMGIPQACDAIRQAALGLQHAFERGMVHRDIKPSNLLYTPRGQVKVLDLGLAMLNAADLPENAHRVTQAGYVLGTPDFLAPEQAQNPMGVDIRADIYALGATLFYILTVKVPFEGATPTEKLLKHVTDPAPSVMQHRPEVPQELDGVIRWLMAKKPEERPQTPAQVAMILLPFCPPQSGPFPMSSATPMATAAMAQPAAAVPMAQPVQQTPFAQPMPSARPVQPARPAPAYPQAVAAPVYPHAVPYSAAEVETEIDTKSGAEAFAGFRADDPDEDFDEPAPRKKGKKGSDDEDDDRPKKKKKADPDRVRIREPKKRSNAMLFVFGGVAGVGALIAIVFGLIYAFKTIVPDNGGPLEKNFDNSIGIKFVKIEPGTLRMGSPENEDGREGHEGPQTTVQITKPFYMASTEVTYGQYVAIMNNSRAYWPSKRKHTDSMPVEKVSWSDANEFCKRLNSKEGVRRKGWAYRLPTEAEWEYCCRAGTASPFSFGEKIKFQQDAVFAFDSDDKYAIENEAIVKTRQQSTYPVNVTIYASDTDKVKPLKEEILAKDVARLPNAWGLYDMHGNVAEWCQDFWSETLPSGDDPTGPTSAAANWHVIRGGSYFDKAVDCRSAVRIGKDPKTEEPTIGFRIVYAELPQPAKK